MGTYSMIRRNPAHTSRSRYGLLAATPMCDTNTLLHVPHRTAPKEKLAPSPVAAAATRSASAISPPSRPPAYLVHYFLPSQLTSNT